MLETWWENLGFLEQFSVLLVVFFVSTTINAYICTVLWKVRGDRGAFTNTIDKAIAQSSIGQNVTMIQSNVQTIEQQVKTMHESFERLNGWSKDLEDVKAASQTAAQDLWQRIQGALGGYKKGENAEVKAVMNEVAEVMKTTGGAIEYPNLARLDEDAAKLVEAGVVSPETIEKIARLSNVPGALPMMEKAAAAIYKKQGVQSGGSGWFS